MKNKGLVLFAVAALLLVSCKPDPERAYKGLTRLGFSSTELDFPNPERGFYRPIEVHSAEATAIASSSVEYMRKSSSLLLLEFYLTDYLESDIAQNYLDLMQEYFNNVREGGAKAIVRFAYQNNEKDTPWDATEEWVLRHIEQVKPILQANSDVILVLQAGFIGVWGEWYYTTNFRMNPITEAHYAPRKRVLMALLDAMPKNRQVALRTPAFKMKMMGLSLPDTLTSATAHLQTDLSRIAGHNDCFLASANDTGTYNSDNERNFWKAETRYTIMGGESCATSPLCLCDNAVKQLEAYHWTYANSAFHMGVLSKWREGKCYDEISKRLGYRLALTHGYVSPDIVAGTEFRLVLKIRNEGFAAPQNPRSAEIVLVSSSGEKTVVALDNVDPRTWYERMVSTIDVKLTAPKAGEYTVYLNLPDPEPRLYGNPLYSIRLANDGIWDDATGFNEITNITIH